MDHVKPGPINSSLLRLQEKHISTKVWTGDDRVFRARHSLWRNLPAEAVQQSIRDAGFGNVLLIEAVDINNNLLTALVERWRPETHTFHLPNGECTVTLEDVAVQFGIAINGEAVTGATNLDWSEVCQHFLGVAPPSRALDGQRLKISWLEQQFNELPENANKHLYLLHGRALLGQQ